MNINDDLLKKAIYEGFKMSCEGNNFECYGGKDEPTLEEFIVDYMGKIETVIADINKCAENR